MRLHPIAAAAALDLVSLATLPALVQEMPQGADPQGRPQQGNKLERVEITARPQSDTELRRRAPVAKQIYGREEMDKYGDNNLADVLDLGGVPDLEVEQYPVADFAPTDCGAELTASFQAALRRLAHDLGFPTT